VDGARPHPRRPRPSPPDQCVSETQAKGGSSPFWDSEFDDAYPVEPYPLDAKREARLTTLQEIAFFERFRDLRFVVERHMVPLSRDRRKVRLQPGPRRRVATQP
jgi:hypothetical protein